MIKLVCIKTDPYNELIIGDIYTTDNMETAIPMFIRIEEISRWLYPKDLFISLTDFRENRINSILDI